jgi:flagellar export protein FliJ
MAKFIFRAEAALTLRRKQEEAARLSLADAQQQAQLAEAQLARAETAERDALARSREAEAQATDLVLAIWYRNWIKRQQREVARCAQVLDGRRAEVMEAERKVMEAHKGVRVLERLRGRKWSDYQTGERREEQKALDLLGVLQYAMRQNAHRSGGNRT